MSAQIEKIRFGIIGTGGVANGDHAPALTRAPGCLLWSVLSRDAGRAREFAAKHGAAAPQPAHTSLAEFLNDPSLQAVIIASPDQLHAEHVIACARAGKHVLVEKPLVTSLEEGAAVIEACRAQGVKLGVGFHLRWHSGHRELHRLIREEAILGSLRHLRVQWSYKAKDASNWRARGELSSSWALGGLGAHCLDLIHWFAGSPARPRVARTGTVQRNVWEGPREETAMVQLEFARGLTAECTTSVLYDAPRRLEIYGSDGYAECESTLGRRGGGKILINGDPLEFEPASPFENQLSAFSAAIRDGREPEADGAAGLRVLEDMLSVLNGTRLE